MLKIVRELAVDNPLVLKIIMGVIAVTFVLSMGWYGIKSRDADMAISVNGMEIKAQEYNKAYNRAVDSYRNAYKDKFDSEMLEKMDVKGKVIDELVARKLWLESATDLGLSVSDDELRDGIMKIKVFHKDGKFNRKLYKSILEANRLNESAFESSQREEFLIDKMKSIIKDSVYVSNAEVNEAFPLSLPGGKSGTPADRLPDELQRLKKFVRFQKQEKAVMSYAVALRAKAKIKVNKELM
ncbi:MAG: SurA N-terminal domain-containing protein [Nitrospirae bacterium]|nr:SurA N-terminal domain-containing protein [Nitrospirota bacterium]